MLITECKRCKGKIEYLSEMHLIPNTNPPEAGFEGVCIRCSTIYYHKFKQYDTEIDSPYIEEN
jgi:hypothetical protein